MARSPIDDQKDGAASAARSHSPLRTVDFSALRDRVRESLVVRLNIASLYRVTPDQARATVEVLVREWLQRNREPVEPSDFNALIDDLVGDLLGLGPLEPLLADPEVGDIMVNTHSEIYVERGGIIELTDARFADEDHLLQVIRRIAERVGRRIDVAHPLVDARLADGSRVNAVIPPIAVDGPQLSIRKFARIPFDLERLVAVKTMSQGLAELLSAVVKARLNILISGGTGTGKTTLLNAMSRSIGERERVVTIEDAAELQLQQRHVVRLETRPADLDGKGQVSQRDLVVNALRMRPDRIIVGEVRSGEAFDMLQAMNTGHDGSMTSVHANSPRDALARIEQLVGMAGIEMTTRSLRSQIASAIGLVVHLRRLPDGARRVTSVQEIVGMEGELVTMQELLRWDQTGVGADGAVQGRFVATGLRPLFLAKFAVNGLPMPKNLGDLAR